MRVGWFFSGRVLIVVLCGMCAGCVHVEKERAELPALAVPLDFSAGTKLDAAEPGDLKKWLEELGTPGLEELVEEALEENPDFRNVLHRMEATRAEARIAGADLWPGLNASASASRRRVNSLAAGLQVDGVTVNSFDPGFGTSWELDLWGRLRDTRTAALNELAAAGYDVESARLSLAGQVAKAWFSLVETRLQLELARGRLEVFESNERLVESQFERGLSSALDYRLIRSQTRIARAAVARQETVREGQIRQFEVVLGRYPARELEVGGTLPSVSGEVPAGIPSSLLERRPDLRAAEARFEAAVRRLEASVKLRLPQFTLTGSAGTSSMELDNVLDTDFRVWSLAGGLTQPIFQGGAIEGGIERAEAFLDEASEAYRKAALTAFEEVETALASSRLIEEERVHLEAVVEETTAAEDLAWDRYQRGLVDVITVLESQRRAFDAESNLLSLRNLELQNRIDLYLALGGFYNVAEDPPAMAAVRTTEESN